MPVSTSGKRPQGKKPAKAVGDLKMAGKVAADKTATSKTAARRGETPSKAVVSVSKPSRSQPRVAREIVLPEGYAPSDEEPFMNALQRLYFRSKLLEWKEDILRETRATLDDLHSGAVQHADLADRATHETDRALELRARDRQRKLVNKIDAALARIEDGSYGFCEDTGEPISLKRLEARPIATLSIEAQERHERRERVYRED